jgi:hypothetical protein
MSLQENIRTDLVQIWGDVLMYVEGLLRAYVTKLRVHLSGKACPFHVQSSGLHLQQHIKKKKGRRWQLEGGSRKRAS